MGKKMKKKNIKALCIVFMGLLHYVGSFKMSFLTLKHKSYLIYCLYHINPSHKVSIAWSQPHHPMGSIIFILDL